MAEKIYLENQPSPQIDLWREAIADYEEEPLYQMFRAFPDQV